MQKKYILTTVAILAVLGGSLYYFVHPMPPYQGPSLIGTATSSAPLKPAPAAYQGRSSLGTSTIKTTPVPDVTISVDGRSYAAYVAPGGSVLDAMNELASTTDLTFTAKDFPGMGEFVGSINGKENTGGSYWFLYVDGKESSAGISSTVLQPGDAVEWKYEQGY